MRFTIGRLMTVVIGVALLLLLVRSVGPRAGLLIGGWLSLAGPAWALARHDSAAVASRATLQWFGVVQVALGFGAILQPRIGLGAFALVVLGLPVVLGSGLGRLSAARRANRTSPTPRPTGPIWLGILVPALAIAGVICLVLLLPCTD